MLTHYKETETPMSMGDLERMSKSGPITFCIITFGRTEFVKFCLSSIDKHAPKDYSVKLLVMGEFEKELHSFLATQKKDRIEVIVSPVILGCGDGRKLLVSKVKSPFTMMLDDDMYLVDDSITEALKVLENDSELGAVSMPQYDLQGHVMSLGGRNLVIRNGAVYKRQPRLNPEADSIEVEDLDGGAMLFKTEMREYFSWDEGAGFEDLDKSLQILKSGRWKQAIIPKGRLVHDRSWLGHKPKYERRRNDGLTFRRQHRLFQKKWGFRVDLRTRLLYDLAYPTLTITRCDWAIPLIQKLIQRRYDATMRDTILRPSET
jgi:GT2 family glycosyltransferase